MLFFRFINTQRFVQKIVQQNIIHYTVFVIQSCKDKVIINSKKITQYFCLQEKVFNLIYSNIWENIFNHLISAFILLKNASIINMSQCIKKKFLTKNSAP